MLPYMSYNFKGRDIKIMFLYNWKCKKKDSQKAGGSEFVQNKICVQKVTVAGFLIWNYLLLLQNDP